MNEQQMKAARLLAGLVCDFYEGTRKLVELDMHEYGLQAYINVHYYQSWLLPYRKSSLRPEYLYKQGAFGAYVGFMPASKEEVALFTDMLRELATERGCQAALDMLDAAPGDNSGDTSGGA